MKLRLSDDARLGDERVLLMLDRHVRGRHGTAPILTRTDLRLKRRLARAQAALAAA